MRGIRGLEKAAAGPVVPAAPTPTVPPVHPAWRGVGGPGLSCQHAQHQLSLPRPPPSSPLSANPQGRHGPPALQMRKRQFRNWPTVPANTGQMEEEEGRLHGLPQGTQGRAWAQLSSRLRLEYTGQGVLSAWPPGGPVRSGASSDPSQDHSADIDAEGPEPAAGLRQEPSRLNAFSPGKAP